MRSTGPIGAAGCPGRTGSRPARRRPSPRGSRSTSPRGGGEGRGSKGDEGDGPGTVLHATRIRPREPFPRPKSRLGGLEAPDAESAKTGKKPCSWASPVNNQETASPCRSPSHASLSSGAGGHPSAGANSDAHHFADLPRGGPRNRGPRDLVPRFGPGRPSLSTFQGPQQRRPRSTTARSRSTTGAASCSSPASTTTSAATGSGTTVGDADCRRSTSAPSVSPSIRSRVASRAVPPTTDRAAARTRARSTSRSTDRCTGSRWSSTSSRTPPGRRGSSPRPAFRTRS